ncbi:MAG: hypothetical protein ACI9CO_000597 [Candidatus Azotimanducaceae bacterium]|jgi:hypothetical protein
MYLGRRDFVRMSTALCAANAFSLKSDVVRAQEVSQAILPWSHGIPPIFCTAYIDPGIESQKGQEQTVAKYPLALVPQDGRRHFVQWRDDVRSINPDIMLLGYQMVIEETTVPGPGHDVMRGLADSWVEYPGGYQPTVKMSATKIRRIFDPRHKEWGPAFLDACEATLNSYSYDGLFFDQCTIFGIASLSSSTREEMLGALREVIVELRRRHPKKLFVGNSAYSFSGLSGELNENLESDLSKNSEYMDSHSKPEFNLYQFYTQDISDNQVIKEKLNLALMHKRFFGVAANYQKVEWYDFFDDLVEIYKKKTSKPSSPNLWRGT